MKMVVHLQIRAQEVLRTRLGSVRNTVGFAKLRYRRLETNAKMLKLISIDFSNAWRYVRISVRNGSTIMKPGILQR